MSYRSIGLIAILVFGILFSLLYSSSYIANLKDELVDDSLASKRAEFTIYRLRTPENTCFTIDDQKLTGIDKGMTTRPLDPDATAPTDTLSYAIKEADTIAESDMESEEQLQPPVDYFEMMGNRYSGRGLYFDQAGPLIPFVNEYESSFNHTITRKVLRGFSDDIHSYSCNFGYNGNYYGLDMKFYSLRFLDVYSGFTAISIPDGKMTTGGSNSQSSQDLVQTKTIRSVYPFNDTIIWTNDGSKPVTLQINYNTTATSEDNSIEDVSAGNALSNMRQRVVTIYPTQSFDISPNNMFYDSEDGVFNFIVKEFPSVRGTIITDNYPVCSLDTQQIKSLFSHTLYPIKLPWYVPVGYDTTICMLADKSDFQIFFWNKELPEDKMGQPGGFQDSISNVEEGAIMIYQQFDRIAFGGDDNLSTPNNATQRTASYFERVTNATSGGISLLNGGPQLVNIDADTIGVGIEQITEERQRELAEQYTSSGQHAPYIYVSPQYRASTLIIFYSDSEGEPLSMSLRGRVPLGELVLMAKSFED